MPAKILILADTQSNLCRLLDQRIHLHPNDIDVYTHPTWKHNSVINELRQAFNTGAPQLIIIDANSAVLTDNMKNLYGARHTEYDVPDWNMIGAIPRLTYLFPTTTIIMVYELTRGNTCDDRIADFMVKYNISLQENFKNFMGMDKIKVYSLEEFKLKMDGSVI